jgi:ribosome maturation factor RimP
MINKEKIKEIVLNYLGQGEITLVDLQVSQGNSIKVILDSLTGVTIEECVKVSHSIEAEMDRETEDFDLEVSSYGISQPFILPLHYQKNVNRVIEVFLKKGKSIKGQLKSVELNEKNELSQIEVAIRKKEKIEGKKRKTEIEELLKIKPDDIQKAKLIQVF